MSTTAFFNKTLYASPYMVMTENEYTKHYFIEGERVCSKIGGGFAPASTMPTTEPLEFIEACEGWLSGALGELVGRQLECTHYQGAWTLAPFLEPAHNENDAPETLQYFYHSDHLGSASFITDASGFAEQHIQYLPFGELFVNQQNTEFDSRYKFTAKELDNETNYSYFGARYYDSDISIWLSIDPLAHERSWVSPYNYCLNNPIGRIDLDGNICGDYYNTNGNWLGCDGINDNKAYVADSKNKDGSFKNAKELSISNSELLDRAAWVYGESGGSGEKIINRTQNTGDASSVTDARVVDYYAFAIQNAVTKDGSFEKTLKNRMSKKVEGKTVNTSEGYFNGTGIGGNVNSKRFAQARKSGMEELMKLDNANNAISAVIKSVTALSDPTGGARAWIGGSDARRYVNNSDRKFSMGDRPASLQFSFTSNNSRFYHSFYRIGR
jgi:RHS repeat-associated protein